MPNILSLYLSLLSVLLRYVCNNVIMSQVHKGKACIPGTEQEFNKNFTD